MDYLYPRYEIELLNTGRYSRIVGIDEVGRGCWAGPVAVGAYIYSTNLKTVEGVHDSKRLAASKREAAYSVLKNHNYLVKLANVSEIDSIGIGKTVEQLIRSIVAELSTPDTFFLVDGRFATDFGKSVEQIIHGDFLHYSIAAASILAKVERDSLMRKLDLEYPDYGFAKHKGYGTKFHSEAISKLGICSFHRKSYAPIKKYINKVSE
jgi:ribonuclease HII